MAKWAEDRLNALVKGEVTPPRLVQTLRLGTLDSWGEGWIKKTWMPDPAVMHEDGTLFGGHIAALADQAMALATMTVVPEDIHYRTLNLNLTFVRVGKAEPLDIEARVTSQTKRIVNLHTSFYRPAGELIAEATAQQIWQSQPV